jgi:hypothetical protein
VFPLWKAFTPFSNSYCHKSINIDVLSSSKSLFCVPEARRKWWIEGAWLWCLCNASSRSHGTRINKSYSYPEVRKCCVMKWGQSFLLSVPSGAERCSHTVRFLKLRKRAFCDTDSLNQTVFMFLSFPFSLLLLLVISLLPSLFTHIVLHIFDHVHFVMYSKPSLIRLQLIRMSDILSPVCFSFIWFLRFLLRFRVTFFYTTLPLITPD